MTDTELDLTPYLAPPGTIGYPAGHVVGILAGERAGDFILALKAGGIADEDIVVVLPERLKDFQLQPKGGRREGLRQSPGLQYGRRSRFRDPDPSGSAARSRDHSGAGRQGRDPPQPSCRYLQGAPSDGRQLPRLAIHRDAGLTIGMLPTVAFEAPSPGDSAGGCYGNRPDRQFRDGRPSLLGRRGVLQ